MTTSTAYLHLQSKVLRGGRMVKFRGAAASIAPMIGAVVAPVLMAGAISMGTAGTAWAVDECGAPPGAGGTLDCANIVYPNITYTGDDGFTLNINGANIRTTGNNGVTFRSNPTTTDAVVINATLFNRIRAGQNFRNAIEATNNGTGNAEVTLGNGLVTSGHLYLSPIFGTDR